jgi:hypothetical protein
MMAKSNKVNVNSLIPRKIRRKIKKGGNKTKKIINVNISENTKRKAEKILDESSFALYLANTLGNSEKYNKKINSIKIEKIRDSGWNKSAPGKPNTHIIEKNRYSSQCAPLYLNSYSRFMTSARLEPSVTEVALRLFLQPHWQISHPSIH